MIAATARTLPQAPADVVIPKPAKFAMIHPFTRLHRCDANMRIKREGACNVPSIEPCSKTIFERPLNCASTRWNFRFRRAFDLTN